MNLGRNSDSVQRTSIYRAWNTAAERAIKKGQRAIPLEDYVTMALAEILKTHPQPLLRALCELGLLSDQNLTTSFIATHQEVVPGCVPDMVWQLETVIGEQKLFWFEMKIHADARAEQNEKYLQAANSYALETRPQLVSLSKTRLDSRIPFLSWQQLADCVEVVRAEMGESDWPEFVRFLDEILAIRVPLHSDRRTSARMVLERFTPFANDGLRPHGYNTYMFPVGAAIDRALNDSIKMGKFTCTVRLNGHELQVFAGLNQNECWQIGVICKRITDRNKGWNLRPRIITEGRTLGGAWHESEHEWLAIECLLPHTQGDEGEALLWLQERWRELCDTDILGWMLERSKP